MPPSIEQLQRWFASPAPVTNLGAQICGAALTPRLLEMIRAAVPDLSPVPTLTYSLYREFERSGERPGYQNP